MPITTPLTVAGITFNRINIDNNTSEWFFRTDLAEWRFTIAHSYEKALVGGDKMERHLVKFRKTIFATVDDPEYWVESYYVMRVPRRYAADTATTTAMLTVLRALADNQTITTNVFTTNVLGWEV